MDMSSLDYLRIALGVIVLLYVANCLINQKVWIRKTFSWGAKEDFPKIFLMNLILGTMAGIWLIASPFIW